MFGLYTHTVHGGNPGLLNIKRDKAPPLEGGGEGFRGPNDL